MLNEMFAARKIGKTSAGYEFMPRLPRITCNDGSTFSVQADNAAYCKPRRNFAQFTHVEVGFPNFDPPSSWMSYCESTEDPQGTVYGYIPIELVEQFIVEHGGIKE